MFTPTEFAINSVVWQVCDYFELPIIYDYSITRYYTNGFFSDGSIVDAYARIALDLILFRDRKGITTDFSHIVQKSLDWINNNIAMKSKEFETSALLKEILDIQLTESLMRKIREVSRSPSPKKVKEIYEELKKIIFSPVNRDNMSKTGKSMFRVSWISCKP